MWFNMLEVRQEKHMLTGDKELLHRWGGHAGALKVAPIPPGPSPVPAAAADPSPAVRLPRGLELGNRSW